jgi:hypothetical protein
MFVSVHSAMIMLMTPKRESTFTPARFVQRKPAVGENPCSS